MTASGPTQATPVNLPREAEVIAFLRTHPSFLDQHPELLSQLEIPHGSGDAVSLLERQVAVLREENARLKQQFEQLVGHAARGCQEFVTQRARGHVRCDSRNCACGGRR